MKDNIEENVLYHIFKVNIHCIFQFHLMYVQELGHSRSQLPGHHSYFSIVNDSPVQDVTCMSLPEDNLMEYFYFTLYALIGLKGSECKKERNIIQSSQWS